jgi:hypothetical protein
MRYTVSFLVLFFALLLLELLLQRLLPSVAHVPIVLPFLLVLALYLPTVSRAPLRALFTLSLLGGLALEFGSAAARGMVLLSVIGVTLAAYLIVERFARERNMIVLFLVLALGMGTAGTVLLFLGSPEGLSTATVAEQLSGIPRTVFLPTALGIPIGLLLHVLVQRRALRGFLQPLIAETAE